MAKTDPTSSTTVMIAEILSSVDIARRTWNRWMDAGLVPRPQMAQAPSGRGLVGVWPWWVVERGLRIRELQAKGVPLSQVLVTLDREAATGYESRVVGAERVADRWLERGSAEQFYAAKTVEWGSKSRTRGGIEETADRVVIDRRRKLKAPLRTPSLADVFGELVGEHAKEAGLSKQHAEKLRALAIKRPVLQTTLTLFFLGYNPVLLWDGHHAKVIPDVMVPLVFSFTWLRLTAPAGRELKMSGHPLSSKVWPFAYCVINLWPVARGLIPFGAISDTPGAYTMPLYLPSRAVMSMDRGDSAPMEYPFNVIVVGPHPADLQMQVLTQRGRPLASGDTPVVMVDIPTSAGFSVSRAEQGREATQPKTPIVARKPRRPERRAKRKVTRK